MEIPVALTPWTNMIAPKPQANPVTRATTMARPGAAMKACRTPETVATVMITGMATHETKMKMAQTFSHDHRPRKRMGSVNVPFIKPESTARETPAVRSELGELKKSLRGYWVAPVVSDPVPAEAGTRTYRSSEARSGLLTACFFRLARSTTSLLSFF